MIKSLLIYKEMYRYRGGRNIYVFIKIVDIR